MRDPRTDPYPEGIPYPPTHPQGQHAQQVVICQECGDPTTDHVGPGTPNPDCPCCSWRKGEHPRRGPVRMPCPAGVDPEKWAAMPRRERRELARKKAR